MELNEDQQQAIQDIVAFVQGPNRYFVFKGPAGTGKSTCIVRAVVRILGLGLAVALTSPTNKATRNLRQIRKAIDPDEDLNLRTATIYSLLGLTLSSDGEVREAKADRDVGHLLSQLQVVIVDEAFMVSEKLAKYIDAAAKNHRIKFIFVGDPFQVPPVGEAHSPINELPCNALLEKVVRHDNAILNLATEIRKCIKDGRIPDHFETDYSPENGGVICLKPAKFFAKIQEVYGEVKDSENTRTIAWKNDTVDMYNDVIREAIYGRNPAIPFEVGERITCRAPLMDISNMREVAIFATTDEEVIVRASREGPHPVFGEIECHVLQVTKDTGASCLAYLPTQKGAPVLSRLLASYANAAREGKGKWEAFWSCKELFAYLAPCHALTVHRAQGSTYDTVFVDLHELISACKYNMREGLQLMYTAVTRPANTLYLKWR